jgi:hypothetical protein
MLETKSNASRAGVHPLGKPVAQSDLFTPDDGNCEHSAVTTHLAFGPAALWPFAS